MRSAEPGGVEGGSAQETWVRDQIARYEATGGREANTLRDTGIPIVVLTTLGRRTSSVRKSAVMRVEHEGRYALVGSKGGAAHDPLWCGNLRAHPDRVWLQDGPVPGPVRVREVEGPERVEWWRRAVGVFPRYADYQQATPRVIPVFVAEPLPPED